MDSREVEAFGVLGIPVGSDRDEALRAYHRLAHANHPDVCEDVDAADRFAKVAAAYELISHIPARGVTAAPWRPREPVPVPWRSLMNPPIVAGPVRVEPARRSSGQGVCGV